MKPLSRFLLFLISYSLLLQVAAAQDFGVDKTYSVSRTALKAGYTSTTAMKNQPASDVAVSISYYDRLGRPVQSVMQQASPAGNDVVQPQIYDQYGMATKQLLPYVAVGSTNGQFKTSAESAQASFYTTQLKVAHDNAPWTEVELEKSPLKRVLRQGGVGSEYQLSGQNTTRYTYRFNNLEDDVVQRWKINTAGELVLDGNYAVNTLSVTIVAGPDWKTTDGNNGKVFTFTDVFGRKVLTRTYNGGLAYDTYTIYDEYENVRFVIPPQLVFENSQQASPSNQAITTAELNKFAVQYIYDNYNRMVEQKAPGTNVGWVYYVYDNSGRLILSQDGEQRANSKWAFIKYDRHDRPVLAGIYGSSSTRLQMQGSVNASITPTSARYEKRGSTVHGYTNTVFPYESNENSYLVVTYYDDYDFMSSWGSAYNFNSSNGINNGPKRNIVRGLETGSKVKVIGTTTWLHTVQYYDDELRPIQAVTDNHLGYQDYLYSLYKYTGETDKLRIAQKYSSATPVTTDYRYVYDDGGRMKEEWMSIDGSAEILVTALEYNELGEVIDTKIHSTDLGVTFAQSVDTRYNIRGGLTNINNTARTNDGTLNDDTGDYFGMQFYYDSSPTGLSFSAKNDGSITGLTWSHAEMTSMKASSFGYTYDDIGQFGTAVYKEQDIAGSWMQNSGHFDVNTVAYDRNGNIKTLKRNQKGTLIDNLSYTYDGNKLLAVNDLENQENGFKDGAELTTEYLYDANGNITKDENRSISSITYNEINLAERITFSSGAYIQYTYDATGMRLAMEVYINSQLEHRADYLGGLILDDGIPEQLAISGGRAVIDFNGSARTYEHQYFITDHQGNTRLTFTMSPKSHAFVATFESENAADEEEIFGYIAEPRVLRTAADANSDGGNEVVRLNTAHPAAAAISIPVTVGDKLDIEVYAYYEGGSDYSTTKGLDTFVKAVAGAFGGVNGGTPGEQAIYDVYHAAYYGGAAAMLGTTNSAVPAAYLNYILFDENGVSYQHGYVQISSNADWAHEKLELSNVPVTKNGIISVYLTNESIEGHVFFDDMKVTLHETNIVQQNAYYPFGLPLDENPFFYTFMPNRFLYQGKEWQTALALNLYDFHARQYDPALGRWLAMDPQGQFASPYNGMGNIPVMGVDPDGEFVWIPIIVGAVLNVTINAIQGNIDNFWQGLGYAAVGGAAGALGAGLAGGMTSALTGGSFAFAGGLAGTATATSVGFGVGAASGAIAGFGTGFVSGLGNNLIGGSNFGDALGSGIKAGVGGAVTGGLLGGVASGIRALNNDRNFWSGQINQVPLAPTVSGKGFTPLNVSQRVSSTTIKTVPLESVQILDEVVIKASYLDVALAFENAPYLYGGITAAGIDCSGLVNRATGHQERVWTTKMGDPPGDWQRVKYNTESHEAFLKDVRKGDLFVWKGKHAAFSAGGERLFHAHGNTTGFTSDLRTYYLKILKYPNIYRQIRR